MFENKVKLIFNCIYNTIQVYELGKKITTMRIDEELIKKAHDLGLNVSKVSENAIREAIEKMEA
jgi:post-segregation antitoxin (ccd killing protein)